MTLGGLPTPCCGQIWLVSTSMSGYEANGKQQEVDQRLLQRSGASRPSGEEQQIQEHDNKEHRMKRSTTIMTRSINTKENEKEDFRMQRSWVSNSSTWNSPRLITSLFQKELNFFLWPIGICITLAKVSSLVILHIACIIVYRYYLWGIIWRNELVIKSPLQWKRITWPSGVAPNRLRNPTIHNSYWDRKWFGCQGNGCSFAQIQGACITEAKENVDKVQKSAK